MFEEQLDKLILRILFCGVFVAILYAYRAIHRFLHPLASGKGSQKFYPSLNSADTFHYLSRIIGFGVIFSYVHINLEQGIWFAVVDLLFQAALLFLVYLVSLFIASSVSLYEFTYEDEIGKRKNLCFGVVHFAQSISLALVVREIFAVANHSLVLLLFIWLYASVAYGLAIKLYRYYSKLSFNKLLAQKNMALGLSYSGYLLGCALLVNSALPKMSVELSESLQLVAFKILLTALIFPLFIIGIKKAFLLQEYTGSRRSEYEFDPERPELGYGLYEGIVFLTSSLLTVVVTKQIFFGLFYPSG